MTVLRIILCLLELDIDRAASLFCLVFPTHTHILYSSFLAKHEESDCEFGAPRSTLIAFKFKDVLI